VDRFLVRPKLGPIPVKGDYAKAQKLLSQYQEKLIDQYNKTTLFSERIPIDQAIWNTFVLNSEWKNTSRIIAALPQTKKHYEEAIQLGLKEFRQRQLVQSPEWLEEHGVCADNMRIEPSTIHQAGHGVVANRYLQKDQVILPVPMIHIPDRTLLEMYERVQVVGGGEQNQPTLQVNRDNRTGYQLLLNYCLGHAESSVLLSPYGPVFALINHNQTLVNVKLQWADPKRSNHHPERLQQPIDSLYNISSSQLAMEVVALRDILPGEELFLDYGDEWEAAWQHHVAHWQPIPGADNYQSAQTMNEKRYTDTLILLTEFEQMTTPYPTNVRLQFDDFFINASWRTILLYNDQGELLDDSNKTEGDWIDCEILKHRNDETLFHGGKMLYTIAIPDPHVTASSKKKKAPKAMKLVKDVPREAFQFMHRNPPYTSDMLLPNAFRHDIRIPNDIFPDRWKNWKHSNPTSDVVVHDADDEVQAREY
jgi:hypothetical protein